VQGCARSRVVASSCPSSATTPATADEASPMRARKCAQQQRIVRKSPSGDGGELLIGVLGVCVECVDVVHEAASLQYCVTSGGWANEGVLGRA
jgi:hypothetical protein